MDKKTNYGATGNPLTFSFDTDTNFDIILQAETGNGLTTVNDSWAIQLEVGSAATEYAPYANIRPISGWTGAKMTRCGKNFINAPKNVELRNATYSYDAAGSMFTLTKGSENVWGQITFKLEMDMSQFAGRKLTLSCTDVSSTYSDDEPRIYVMRQDKSTTIGRMSLNTGANSLTFTVPQGVTALYLIIRIDQNKTAPDGTVLTVRGLQLEIGEVATEFEPYQSDTYAAEFGQTVYGGDLYWQPSGKCDSIYGIVTLDGSDDEGWTIYTGSTGAQSFYTRGYSALAGIAVTGDRQIPGWCSWAGTQDGVITGIRRNDASGSLLYIPTETLTRWGMTSEDLGRFKAMLAENPMQICYKLETPTTIQLTLNQITALQGTNNIWSNAGETTVSGRKDIIWLTHSLLERIAALEAAVAGL